MIIDLVENVLIKCLTTWHDTALTTFEYSPSYSENTLEYFIERISYHDYQGWHYEDLGQQSESEKIIRGWRGSQVNNKNRNHCIQQLDLFFEKYYQADAECHTETLGVILDKLSILYLKYLHLLDISRIKADSLLSVIQELVHEAQVLYDQILLGKKKCIMIPHLKLYDEHAQ